MDRPHGRRPLAASLVILLSVVLTGCGPGASAGPSASPSPTTPPPSPSPGSSGTAFNLTVLPASFAGKIFSGSKVVLLVSVDGSPSDGPVTISGSIAGGTVTIEPEQLLPGTVGEITVIPAACQGDCGDVDSEVVINAERGSVQRSEKRVLTVAPEASQLEPEARVHLAPFITWLAANRPELGITAATQWEGVPGSWVLIVEHYVFLSEDWELDLEWHVMIAPSDWSRIYLRRRGSEAAPSVAFQIDSVSAKDEPHEIEPPEAVWR
jgi:hypothetical protein